MAHESIEQGEKNIGSSTSSNKNMTLNQAVNLGEYNPDYLSTFPEWHTMSRHVQFQLIKKGLDNRNKQLMIQWAEINNMLDFRLKPQLAEALENLQKQMKLLDRERERLFFEYSK